jgi:multidrug resistance protein, MATE family
MNSIHLNKTPSYTELLHFAIPLAISMITVALNTLVDTWFISKLGTTQLAAVPMAGMVYILFWILMSGMLRSIIAFSGREYGTGNYKTIGNILVQYHWLALAGLPIMMFAIQLWPLFSWLSALTNAVDYDAWTYLHIRAWETPFSLLVILYSSFYQSIGNSRLPMIIAIIGLLLNVLLDYGLIFGNLGFPAMGVAGSALATVLANIFIAVLYLSVSQRASIKHKFNIRLYQSPDWSKLKDLLRIGLPQGLGDFTELLAWTGLIIIVGRLGESALASNNIALQVTHLIFLPGLALGIASASYMGRFLGAGHADHAHQSTMKCLKLAMLYMGSMGIPLWFFGETIAQQFSSDPEVISQTAVLFKIMALYQVFDGISIVYRSTLGGAGDTLKPTLILFGCAFLIMFPLAIYLTQVVEIGVPGAWIGAFTYIVALSISMWWRFKTNHWRSVKLYNT